jgi:hypothetical protein
MSTERFSSSSYGVIHWLRSKGSDRCGIKLAYISLSGADMAVVVMADWLDARDQQGPRKSALDL